MRSSSLLIDFFDDEIAFNASFLLDGQELGNKGKFSYVRVDERDENGTLVLSIASPTSYELTSTTTTSDTTGGDVAQVVMRGNDTSHPSCPPRCPSITAIFSLFELDENITFASETFNVSRGGFKMQVNIDDWEFSSVNNTLDLVYGTEFYDLNNTGIDFVLSNATGKPLVKTIFFEFTLSDARFSFDLQHFHLSDGNATPIENLQLAFQSSTEYTMTITFPWFNSSLDYDPELSPLLDPLDGPSECVRGSNKGSWNESWLALLSLVVLVPCACVCVTLAMVCATALLCSIGMASSYAGRRELRKVAQRNQSAVHIGSSERMESMMMREQDSDAQEQGAIVITP